MLLEDRVVLVTGAGSGIGRAVAQAYAREGATVVLLGRTQSTLEACYDSITGEGGKATLVPLNLDKELHRVPELVQQLHQRFGRLDMLVNSAAIMGTGTLTTLSACKPSAWEAALRVNLTAPFFLTRELLPLLQLSPRGVVVNMVCDVARTPRPYWGPYSVSKAALVNMTAMWALETSLTALRFYMVDAGKVASDLRKVAYPGEDPATLPAPESVVPLFLHLARHAGDEPSGKLFELPLWYQQGR
jgi:NAD(P)-dependent dehydrogenase (short-subunit alcohol dehydrogenase family)